jgi:hypothetical protein
MEMFKIILEHLMNIFAINNDGKRRKGKYKRIKRPEKFDRVVSYYIEEKTIARYDKVVDGRKQYLKKKR